MRIVHIEDFFHPYAGYQVNILSKYMSKLGHEVYVVTSELDKIPEHLTAFFGADNILEKDEEFYQETGVRIIRIPLRFYISGRSVYKKSIFQAVDDLKPDVLYIHGNDTWIGIQYILRSAKLNYPLISDSHMLEMASVNKFNKLFRWIYKRFVTPKIIKNKIFVIRTQDDSYVNRRLGVPLNQTPWISTGSDMMLFHENSQEKLKFRKEYKIESNSVIAVYIGKLDEAKGGRLLAQAFEKKIISENGKEIVLIVVGNTAGEYGKEVEGMFSRSENRIIRFPTQKYIDLPKFYQIGDFALFPRQCSLSFYDAQACRLPVIAEDNNINIDRLSHNNGLIFHEGEVDSLRKQIIAMLNLSDDAWSDMRNHSSTFVEENYNYEAITKQYLELIENLKKSI